MPPTQNAKLTETMEAIVLYMKQRDQEERQVMESLRALPELVTAVALLTEQVRELKNGQAVHEAILHGEKDQPGLVGKFMQQKTDVERINAYFKIIVSIVTGSTLIMIVQLFLSHGTTLTP